MLILLVFSLGVHEFAHAWAAFKFGDDTAASMGRLTLNPIPHIDIFGLLPIIMGVFIGWAKPVPVNPYKVRNPSLGLPLIAAAGPISNLIQLLIGSIIYFTVFRVFQIPPFGFARVLNEIIQGYIFLNLMLALFNLFPIYPLDGGKVITLLMAEETANKYENTMHRLGYMPLVVLIVLNMSSNGAIFRFWFSFWSPVFNPIFRVFSVPIDLNALF